MDAFSRMEPSYAPPCPFAPSVLGLAALFFSSLDSAFVVQQRVLGGQAPFQGASPSRPSVRRGYAARLWALFLGRRLWLDAPCLQEGFRRAKGRARGCGRGLVPWRPVLRRAPVPVSSGRSFSCISSSSRYGTAERQAYACQYVPIVVLRIHFHSFLRGFALSCGPENSCHGPVRGSGEKGRSQIVVQGFVGGGRHVPSAPPEPFRPSRRGVCG